MFVVSPPCHLSLLCDVEQPRWMLCIEFTILLSNLKLQEYSGPYLSLNLVPH